MIGGTLAHVAAREALGDDVAFIPGHGPTSTLGAERVSNPFLQD